MSKFSRGRLIGCLLLLAMAIGAIVLAPAAGAADLKNTPKKYYLALGDSLAFGFQRAKVLACAGSGCTSPNTQFTTGYVDDFATHLKTIKPDLETINEGCPAATSVTLISVAGCTTYPFPLHHPYGAGKTQLQDALDFIAANEGKVTPITFNIGANDALAVVTACGGLTNPNVIPCLFANAPAQLNTVGTNAGAALAQLRAAAPGAEIIVVGGYNPYAAIGFSVGNSLTAAINSVLANAAASVGGDFADPFPAFNLASPQPQTICSLTLMCPGGVPSLSGDIHASDAGYQQIADLIWTASGYSSLE